MSSPAAPAEENLSPLLYLSKAVRNIFGLFASYYIATSFKVMKILRLLALLLLTMVLTTACPSIEPEPEPEPNDGYVQLLSRYEALVDYTPWPAETKPDANLTGPGGNFSYWWEHRTEVSGAEALWGLCRLKDEQLATMSTRNLARTVYLYPYGFEFDAFPDSYNGIFLEMGRFNGTQELMRRSSGAAELLHLYQEVHYPQKAPGTYIPLDYTEYLNESLAFVKLPYLSFLLITAVDYGRFQPQEIRTLANAIANKMEEIAAANAANNNELYSWIGNVRIPYVLGAFVAYRYDAALREKERYDLRSFIDYSFNPYLDAPGLPLKLDTSQNVWVLDQDLISKITEIVSTSLLRLMQ